MKFQLSRHPVYIKYTERERELFSLIPQKKIERLSTTELASLLYNEDNRISTPRQTTFGRLISLGNKFRDNKEPFQLVKTKRAGPHAMEFWLERI